MELATEQWNRIEPVITELKPKKDHRGPYVIHEKFYEAFHGYYELGLPGKIYHSGIRHTKHAIGDSSNGSSKVFSNALPKSW
jgi:hypothetical protein